jgi:hypothetical protein
MIHYQLQCSQDHGFDGWFRDSASFEVQAAQGLLECPACGDKKVRRALMTPAVAKPRATVPASPPVPAPAAPKNPVCLAGGQMPDQVRAMLQQLRAKVEQNCDYVGPEFADEARKMHRGESDRRGIYGEATQEQAESLADEGIEVARIPWVPRAES